MLNGPQKTLKMTSQHTQRLVLAMTGPVGHAMAARASAAGFTAASGDLCH
jgi:hypothetical protein